jgi:hypothetical protein
MSVAIWPPRARIARDYLGNIGIGAVRPESIVLNEQICIRFVMAFRAWRALTGQTGLGAVTMRSGLLTRRVMAFTFHLDHDRGPVHIRLTQEHAQHARYPQGR